MQNKSCMELFADKKGKVKMDKTLAEIWNDWKSADDELPDYWDAFLVLWRVPEWLSFTRLFWAILEWDEEHGWIYNDVMKKEAAKGNTIEIVYWKELPDTDIVEELMELQKNE